MSTLTELMQNVADRQPDDGVTDPATVTALGRARVRRRRTTAGLVTTAVVAAVVAPFAIHAASEPEPAAPTGHVIRLDTAVPGVAGRDWTALSSVTSRMLHVGANHLVPDGELPDGRVVVALVNATGTTILRHGVLDPTTGEVGWFPTRDVGPYLGRDGNLLVFGTPSVSGDLSTAADHPYQVYDLSAASWRSLPADRAIDLEWGGSVQSQVVSDGMLYVALDTVPPAPLWRVPLDGSAGWRQVGTVGSFGVGAGSLVYTTRPGPGRHTITVVDLASGSTRTSDAPYIGRCASDHIGVSRAYVVLSLGCPAHGQVDRLVVLDRSLEPLGTVDAGYLEPTAVTNTVVGFSIPNRRLPAGPGGPAPGSDPHVAAASRWYGGYLYHPASGRLVRLSTQAPATKGFALPADPVPLWHADTHSQDRPGRVIFDVVTPR